MSRPLYKSVMLDCSSDGVRSHTEGSNSASFSVALANPTNKLARVVKCVPKMITIPHLFPNIDQHHNTFTVLYPAELSPSQIQFTLTVGQYTEDELIAEVNAKLDEHLGAAGVLSLAYNPATLHFEWTEAGSGAATITSPEHGFLTAIGGLESVTVNQGAASQPMPFLPNLGGLRHVYVHSRRLAPGNMCDARGRQHNVLAIVSLSDTVYGGAATNESEDVNMDDVDYRSLEELTVVDFWLTDSKMRPLYLPPNHHVHITLKVFHT